jgi:hypothetical protein
MKKRGFEKIAKYKLVISPCLPDRLKMQPDMIFTCRKM